MIAAVFDFDGTLVAAPVWQKLIGRQLRARRNLIPTLTHVAVHYPAYPLVKLGLLSGERLRRAWVNHMPWIMRGMREDEADALFRRVIDEDLNPTLRPEVLERLAWHRQQGHMVVILSGAFEGLLRLFAADHDVEHIVGTILEVRNGRFTGRLIPPSCYAEGKVARLRQYLEGQRPRVDWSASYAYADSMTDLPALSLVGHPVAVHPDERLRQEAYRRRWLILEEEAT